MTTSSLMTYCKTSLRLTSDVFDNEVTQLIAEAIADINQATDSPFNYDDPIQCGAVAVYCQANFGYGDEHAEERYDKMLKKIGLRKIKNLNNVEG